MNFFLIIALMRCNSLLICDIQFYPSESQHFPILHLKNAIAITLNIAIYRDQGGTLKEIAQRKHQQAQNNYGLEKVAPLQHYITYLHDHEMPSLEAHDA